MRVVKMLVWGAYIWNVGPTTKRRDLRSASRCGLVRSSRRPFLSRTMESRVFTVLEHAGVTVTSSMRLCTTSWGECLSFSGGLGPRGPFRYWTSESVVGAALSIRTVRLSGLRRVAMDVVWTTVWRLLSALGLCEAAVSSLTEHLRPRKQNRVTLELHNRTQVRGATADVRDGVCALGIGLSAELLSPRPRSSLPGGY